MFVWGLVMLAIGFVSATPVAWTAFADIYNWLYELYLIPYTTPLILATNTMLVGVLALLAARRRSSRRLYRWLMIVLLLHAILTIFYSGMALVIIDLAILIAARRRSGLSS